MAKKGRPMGRYIKGNIDMNVELGTLAGNTALVNNMPDAVTERTLVSSIVNSYTLSGLTLGDNIGPIQFGVAHGDYSLAEVEAWVEQQTGWAEADLVAQEISKRKIRRIGVIEMVGASGDLARGSLNEGRPVKTKLNWILNAGQTLQVWVHNMGSGALATTDPNFHVQGHANLWPK